MKYRHPNDRKIILCAVTAVVCLAAFIAVILRICLAADAPRILFLVFILTPIGFLISTAFLVRFCIERARDKKNGVAGSRPLFVLSKSEIACITVLAISLISFLVSIVFMCYPKIAPAAVTAVLFLAGIAGYFVGGLWARFLFFKKRNEKAEQEQLQNTENKKDN